MEPDQLRLISETYIRGGGRSDMNRKLCQFGSTCVGWVIAIGSDDHVSTFGTIALNGPQCPFEQAIPCSVASPMSCA